MTGRNSVLGRCTGSLFTTVSSKFQRLFTLGYMSCCLSLMLYLIVGSYKAWACMVSWRIANYSVTLRYLTFGVPCLIWGCDSSDYGSVIFWDAMLCSPVEVHSGPLHSQMLCLDCHFNKRSLNCLKHHFMSHVICCSFCTAVYLLNCHKFNHPDKTVGRVWTIKISNATILSVLFMTQLSVG